MTDLTEAGVETAKLDWMSAPGWQVGYGSDIAPDTPNVKRAAYGQVVLERLPRDVPEQFNANPMALDDAFRRLTRPYGATVQTLGMDSRAEHRATS